MLVVNFIVTNGDYELTYGNLDSFATLGISETHFAQHDLVIVYFT